MSAARTGAAAAALVLAALAAAAPGTATAGEGVDNCTGFITAVPTTITVQGVWCLAADLSINDPAWTAITVDAHNVTVDCNGHVLATTAGLDNMSIGIRSIDRVNTIVRDCSIRGFAMGISTSGGSGHLVEDNHFRDIRATAINVLTGSNHLVRRNRIENSGGSLVMTTTGAIRANADIVDNTIDGLMPQTGDYALYGIVVWGPDVEVSRNVVRGFAPGAAKYATGIYSAQARTVVADNVVVSPTLIMNTGIVMGGPAGAASICVGNHVSGFNNALGGCTHSLGNASQ